MSYKYLFILYTPYKYVILVLTVETPKLLFPAEYLNILITQNKRIMKLLPLAGTWRQVKNHFMVNKQQLVRRAVDTREITTAPLVIASAYAHSTISVRSNANLASLFLLRKDQFNIFSKSYL